MSRFVSGGTIAAHGPGDAAPSHVGDVSAEEKTREPLGAKKNLEEWEAVRQELEEDRKKREAQRVSAAAGGGQEQSLYEILQANKAAKQAAFEEANKLKNQFRPLDDDEIHFLDEVRARERKEEERLRRETEEGLRLFRLRQKSGAADEDPERQKKHSEEEDSQLKQDDEGEDWAALGGRKRKRAREGGVKGVKRRSMAEEGVVLSEKTREGDAEEKRLKMEEGKKKIKEEERSGAVLVEQIEKKKQSLVAYDSDEDEDD